MSNESQGIDWNDFSEAMDGDEDLMKMLGQLFLQHIDAQVARVQAAIADEDASEIENAAHGLKGALAQVYAEHARNSAAELERRGNAKDIGNLEGIGSELVELVAVARASMFDRYGEADEEE